MYNPMQYNTSQHMATNKRQAAQLGPPLALSLEEALLAAEEGFAEVVDCAPGSTSAATAFISAALASATSRREPARPSAKPA